MLQKHALFLCASWMFLIGIDSSHNGFIISKFRLKNKYFTIGFEDENYDEFVRKKLQVFWVQIMKIILRPEEALKIILNLSTIYSEPFADSSQTPTTLICIKIKNRYRCCING